MEEMLTCLQKKNTERKMEQPTNNKNPKKADNEHKKS